VQSKTLSKLNTSIHYLDTNFNNRYQYPVIVFTEEDLNTAQGHQFIRSFCQSPQLLFIQVVHFTVPLFLLNSNKPAIPKRAGNGKSIGYRHMCRFHAKTVYEQPILSQCHPSLEFGWRLDDDSFLYKPVNYDVFSLMRNKQLQYGYIQIRDESSSLIRGLWETVDDFLQMNNDIARTQFYTGWKHTKIYYNNFEISNMSLWMSDKYRRYIEHIDQQGGIYYKRWGDAPIKTIAVTLFTEQSKTFRFTDIPYKHNIYTNRGRT
jgi:hypothetical protein